ncbi:conserved hypothetical protein [Leishmania braziliensis MHOM/BR/75/M2904]|uniref:Uncharacterized protein n=2 Tax=Leishmania braziliensis TaxID=5660 RepID=A4HDD6_LEIBR|nr:conserved hypothetical protein [Leishmania braziliensis MHOM/BR/75/M2904]CAJ2473593.1 unnamed protein product [Leishmania braziliensis]CAM42256.2 conserved hypothetical protein [Leishmania braziliensis MHOM/BR/75/M2904]SYZ66243.1 hypothetical_protein [Leishmania braziliensis MHOM/BR/75/M2904]
MSQNCRSAYDVLARMSDEEDDDVPEDLELTFVPASKRSGLATSRVVGHHASSSTPCTLTSSTGSSATVRDLKPRSETVYEQERNARVRQLLAERQGTTQDVAFSLDMFEAPLQGPYTWANFPGMTSPSASPSPSALYSREGQPPGLSQYRGRSGAEGSGKVGSGGGGGPRRYRMPNPNMSEEEQTRYIRHRRNMAVIRNALREVDPDTLEYMQVTQAPDPLPLSRDRDGFPRPHSIANRGRGSFDIGSARSTSSYRGGGGGCGMRGRGGSSFSPYSAGRGAGSPRGNGIGRGGGGGGSSAPFSPY